MKRKAVVVAGEVFDLGLKGLEEALTEGRTMTLDVAGNTWQVGVLRQERALCLHWMGLTYFAGCTWQRFVLLGFRWPPVKRLSCFACFES